jgi:hypothetical protein
MRSRPLAILTLSLIALAAAIFATRGPDEKAPTGIPPARRQSAAGTSPEPSVDPRTLHDNPDWWAAARKEINDMEYRPTLQKADRSGIPFPGGARPHMVNRSCGFRAYFDLGGMELGPRRGADWTWKLGIEALGREGSASPVAPVPSRIEGGRVVFERGWGKEWYENCPGGIEQLFEVRERPAGTGPLEPKMKACELQASGASAERVILSSRSRRGC